MNIPQSNISFKQNCAIKVSKDEAGVRKLNKFFEGLDKEGLEKGKAYELFQADLPFGPLLKKTLVLVCGDSLKQLNNIKSAILNTGDILEIKRFEEKFVRKIDHTIDLSN